jgi:tetratricopeptide (TPR) repeat protein
MRRAWELKVELYGADHPSTLNSVNNLAELLAQQGRDAEAEPLHRRALEGRTRGLGARHVQTLHSMERLASTLANRERFGEAERLAAAAATASEEVLGPDAPSTLHAQDTRARALVGLGRAEQAEALLRRQLELLQAKKARGDDLGEADDVARDMRVHLGMALAAQGRRTEAEALLLEALPGLPAREAGTARAIRFLLRLYEDWNRTAPDPGRSARAAEWRGRLAAGETAGVPPP